MEKTDRKVAETLTSQKKKADYFKCRYLLTIFRMGLFGNAYGWGPKKPPPPSDNLFHISHNDEIWHRFTLSKEDTKTYKSRDTLRDSC